MVQSVCHGISVLLLVFVFDSSVDDSQHREASDRAFELSLTVLDQTCLFVRPTNQNSQGTRFAASHLFSNDRQRSTMHMQRFGRVPRVRRWLQFGLLCLLRKLVKGSNRVPNPRSSWANTSSRPREKMRYIWAVQDLCPSPEPVLRSPLRRA